MREMEDCAGKGIFALVGSVVAFLSPIGIFILIALLATFGDVYAAWRLSVRLKRKNGTSTGKFRSDSAMKAFLSLIPFSYVAMLAFLCDHYLAGWEVELYCLKATTGAYTFFQVWSILENISSESNETWAKLLQKFMINKAYRHYDVIFDNEKQSDEIFYTSRTDKKPDC